MSAELDTIEESIKIALDAADAATDIPISPGCRIPMLIVVIEISPEIWTEFGTASRIQCFRKYSRKSRNGIQIYPGRSI